jgi:hypothetical protein
VGVHAQHVRLRGVEVLFNVHLQIHPENEGGEQAEVFPL